VIDLNSNSSAANASSTVNVTGHTVVYEAIHSTKTGDFNLTYIGASSWLVTEVNVDANRKPKIFKQYQQTKGFATVDTDIASVNGNK
jgi:hypothetical protein